jgi:putative membrane protein
MQVVSYILIGLVAFLHLYFMWLEMFAWTTRAKRTFRGLDADYFEKTRTLAANQGLYNGFLAAGLIWSLLVQNPDWHFNVALFFLSCVFIAGVYGASTVQRSIFFVQALPALLALIVLYLV